MAGMMRFSFQKPAVSRDRGSPFPAYPDGIATMRNDSGPHPDALLADVRSGREEALGTLLELYRNYLKLLAGTEISLHLQTRANPSDVVQDTFFEACRDFKQFRGTTEAEFLAWLRRILVRNLARLVERHVLTKNAINDASCHWISWRLRWRRSSSRLETALVAPVTSPSTQLHNRERSRHCWPIIWPACRTTTARCSCCGTWRSCRSIRSADACSVPAAPSACYGCGRIDQLRRQLTEEGWV